MKQAINHGVILGIAAIATALALSALLLNWEGGPVPGTTAFSTGALKEGRAATTTDPARKATPPEQEFPKSLLD